MSFAKVKIMKHVIQHNSMSKSFLVMGILSFMAVCSASAVAIDNIVAERDYYRKEVFQKESGVYENDGILYIHSRIPIQLDGNVSIKAIALKRAQARAQLSATMETSSLLRRWALKQTEEARNAKTELPPGVLYVKKLVESYKPDWQFSDWNINVSMRTMADNIEGEQYICALSVEKQSVLDAIPKEFYSPCPPDKLFKVLSKIAKENLKQDEKAFYAKCGVMDIMDGLEGVPTANVEEFSKFKMDMEKYVLSPFMVALKEEAQKISEPKTTKTRTVTTNPQGTIRTEEEKTVTTYATPKMQNLMLSCGNEENHEFKRIESGTKAIKFLFDAGNASKDKEAKIKEALCDNPGDKELWNYYGRLLLDRNEMMAAAICFKIALRLDGQFVYPMVNLSKIYSSMGYKNLAYGLALVARSLADDTWSVTETDKIFKNSEVVQNKEK